ncbi:hypothetical protein [Emticicia sp. 21SJ11W-3]|uniref:hypothetical protein n=1 Tax=Emticicia sp. 21SJ11W-3 TaxID=2916755 RepID=UPI00209ED9AB|nr:hypothetical protein [Emticicia sp. 21SJ11W-3]UTA66810.1 hypothetical protein MB380_14485 [Emticicia sp. 21SJ11W-3]
MNGNVSVDEAIAKGHRVLNLPAVVFMLAGFGITVYLSAHNLIPGWGMVAGFVATFVLSWLWWSFMVTKWRLWAFENVRNVHELKKRAIREKLIWPDNSIFEKTEIRSAADKLKWAELQVKFRHDDLFLDDLTIPNETIIYYSKSKNYLQMILMLLCSAGGVYVLLKTDSYIIGSVMLLGGAYYSFREYKEATNTEPQIILNEEGIRTVSTEFYSWQQISNEEVVSEGSGKKSHFYLVYDHPNGSEHLQIEDFDTDAKSLNQLLVLYRGRSNKKNR